MKFDASRYLANQLPLPSQSARALERLIHGNRRFVEGVRSYETLFNTKKLKELAEKGQSPFAIVPTCSDSRVPAENIFDQGLGDLFVIRVAGNVISSDLIASVEYAAGQFGTPLCVVMGHSGCGAVQAAISYSRGENLNLSGFGKRLLTKIVPSVNAAAQTLSSECSSELVKSSVLMNVRRNAQLIQKRSRFLGGLATENKFAIVGAVFDLHTGQVNFDTENRHKGQDNERDLTESSRMAFVG